MTYRFRSALLFTALLPVALLPSACAVGPDYATPPAPTAEGYLSTPLPAATAAAPVPTGDAQRFLAGQDLEAAWWKRFGSPALDTLVMRALAANPNIDAARAALRQANELVSAQRGFYFPSLTAGLSASRNLTATRTLSPASASGNPYYSLFTANLGVSFTPDVFGANRRLMENLEAQADNQRFQLEATYLTLIANVVGAAVQEASLRGQIDSTKAQIAAVTDLLAILRRQFGFGQIAEADVVAQEAALAQVQQLLPPLEKQLGQQRDLIAVLVGVPPSEEPKETFTLADLHLPADLPVSLPAKLVAQRPDVLAAEALLHAASAQVGVAVAARLPQLTLSGVAGNSPPQVSEFFTPGTNFWTLGAGITAPLFDFGTLLHRERAARAAFDQAGAQYKVTVLAAMQNVADVLRALVADADALQAAATAERAAAHSLEITRRQLELGQIAYLSLLNAQQTYQQAALALVQARAGRLADTASLFQALGGGWWNRPPEDTDAKAAGNVGTVPSDGKPVRIAGE
jgi:NodT family efflux transporter outer membrane factor (OMF) lipoprotein